MYDKTSSDGSGEVLFIDYKTKTLTVAAFFDVIVI